MGTPDPHRIGLIKKVETPRWKNVLEPAHLGEYIEAIAPRVGFPPNGNLRKAGVGAKELAQTVRRNPAGPTTPGSYPLASWGGQPVAGRS